MHGELYRKKVTVPTPKELLDIASKDTDEIFWMKVERALEIR